MEIKLPNYVTTAIELLEQHGCLAYIVGGCVRDALLNKKPNDWDICTSATPQQSLEIFKDFKLITTGLKHGTVCVIIDNFPVEITTFRIDGNYKDNRRPEKITFTPSLAEDLKRRDFTINAMCYSHKEGIIDLNNGISDLNNKIIRCVGNPETRFEEDALRIMRCLRFSAQLGFDIDSNTQNAIFNKMQLLKNISSERITDEFIKLVLSDNYINILNKYEDVFKMFLPNFNLEFKDKIIEKDLRLRLAHIFCNAKCNKKEFFGKLILPKTIKKQVSTLLDNKDLKLSAEKPVIKKHLAILGYELFLLLLKLKHILGEDTKKHIEMLKNIAENNECYTIKQLKISGHDIINLGINDAKNTGKVLDFLLSEVIKENCINEKQALLNLANNYIQKELS